MIRPRRGDIAPYEKVVGGKSWPFRVHARPDLCVYLRKTYLGQNRIVVYTFIYIGRTNLFHSKPIEPHMILRPNLCPSPRPNLNASFHSMSSLSLLILSCTNCLPSHKITILLRLRCSCSSSNSQIASSSLPRICDRSCGSSLCHCQSRHTSVRVPADSIVLEHSKKRFAVSSV